MPNNKLTLSSKQIKDLASYYHNREFNRFYQELAPLFRDVKEMDISFDTPNDIRHGTLTHGPKVIKFLFARDLCNALIDELQIDINAYGRVKFTGELLEKMCKQYQQKNYEGFVQEILQDHPIQTFMPILERLREIAAEFNRFSARVVNDINNFNQHAVIDEDVLQENPDAINKNIEFFNSAARPNFLERYPYVDDGLDRFEYLSRKYAQGDRFLLRRLLSNRELQNQTFPTAKAAADYLIKYHHIFLSQENSRPLSAERS